MKYDDDDLKYEVYDHKENYKNQRYDSGAIALFFVAVIFVIIALSQLLK